MTDIAQDFGFSNWREAEYTTGLTGSRLSSYTSTLKGYASGPFEDAASLEVISDSMPTVLRIGPYRFFFVSLDRGEPPHIHVRRESMVAKFWLDPIALQQAGGYSRAELNTISRLVQEHRQTLLEGWYEFFGR